MRLNSTGLLVNEIDDILASISRETSVHVRRKGKKRLFCKSYLERSPAEDEELFKPTTAVVEQTPSDFLPKLTCSETLIKREKRQKLSAFKPVKPEKIAKGDS